MSGAGEAGPGDSGDDGPGGGGLGDVGPGVVCVAADPGDVGGRDARADDVGDDGGE